MGSITFVIKVAQRTYIRVIQIGNFLISHFKHKLYTLPIRAYFARKIQKLVLSWWLLLSMAEYIK